MKRLWIRSSLFLALIFTASCNSKPSNTSPKDEATFAVSDQISSLDPRKTHSLASSGIVQMLFEGLTRLDERGNILPGAAENVHVSADLKTFTFLLKKEAKWSNGDPVKASDFAQSWKSQLSPQSQPTANYLLFAIKSAKDAFEGKCPVDQVGINVVDDKTLVVTLENPTPYFLQLTATPTYFPVNQSLGDQNVHQVSNGPFCLDSWKPHEAIQLKKHPSYTPANRTKLSKVCFSLVSNTEADSLFKQQKLDWIGTPFSNITQEALPLAKTDKTLKTSPAAGTFFLRVNIEKEPFNNQKIRQAFNLAIDKQAIINEAMREEAIVATSFVPPILGLVDGPDEASFSSTKASELFEAALSEMHLTREELPPITFSFMASDTMKKIAGMIQQKWKEIFNVEVILEAVETPAFYEKVFSKEYTLATGSWFADYFDPMSFLSAFQRKDNGSNNTNWTNSEYSRLLDTSCTEIDVQKRKALLQQAQNILMNEQPIMPILHFSFSFASSEKLEGVTVLPLGNLNM